MVIKKNYFSLLNIAIPVLYLIIFAGIYLFTKGIFFQSYFNVTLLVFLFLLILSIVKKFYSYNYQYILLIFILFTFILINSLLSLFIYGTDGAFRMLTSIFVLMSIFIICQQLQKIKQLEEKAFNFYIKLITYFTMAIGYLSYILQKVDFLPGKKMIVFPEPSHYALFIIPLSLYLVKRTNDWWTLFNLYLLSVLLQNVSLFLGSLLITSLQIRFKVKNLIFLVLIFGGVTVFVVIKLDSVDYFFYRFTFNTKSPLSNLSVLVYISGWEQANLSLLDSLIGLGFNRLGFVGPKGETRLILEDIGYGDLNLFDGGTLGAKIIAENGVLGIFLITLYLYYFVKNFWHLKRNKSMSYFKLFYLSYFMVIFIELFVRGVGYFSPNLIFYALAIYELFKTNQFKKYKYTKEISHVY